MTKNALIITALLGASLLHAEHSKADIKLAHNKHSHTTYWETLTHVLLLVKME